MILPVSFSVMLSSVQCICMLTGKPLKSQNCTLNWDLVGGSFHNCTQAQRTQNSKGGSSRNIIVWNSCCSFCGHRRHSCLHFVSTTMWGRIFIYLFLPHFMDPCWYLDYEQILLQRARNVHMLLVLIYWWSAVNCPDADGQEEENSESLGIS